MNKLESDIFDHFQLEFFDNSVRINQRNLLALKDGRIQIDWPLIYYLAYNLPALQFDQIEEIKKGKSLSSDQVYAKSLSLAIITARNCGHQAHIDYDKFEDNWQTTTNRARRGDLYETSLNEDDEDKSDMAFCNEDFVVDNYGKKICLCVSLDWHAIIYKTSGGAANNSKEEKLKFLIALSLLNALGIGIEEGRDI